MKTKQQILKETLEYYHEDTSRRATNKGGGCEYLTDDGRMCAFGRCEVNPQNAETDPFGKNPLNQSVGKRFEHDEYQMNQSLKDEYRGHSMDFWVNVQDFMILNHIGLKLV